MTTTASPENVSYIIEGPFLTPKPWLKGTRTRGTGGRPTTLAYHHQPKAGMQTQHLDLNPFFSAPFWG